MNSHKSLLAKSYDHKKFAVPPDYALLTQHSRDVAEACRVLGDFLGQTICSVCDLDVKTLNEFACTLKANGWIQDLGKANSHFQAMVGGQFDFTQLIRHEAVSGLFVWLNPKMRVWLKPIDEMLLIALWGAMGHHRKFHDDTKPNDTDALTFHISHPDFAAILSEMAQDLELGSPPVFQKDWTIARTRKEACDLAALEGIRDLQDEFSEMEDDFKSEDQRKRLALIKGLGIAADVAASAIAGREKWATKYSLSDFVTKSLSVGLSKLDFEKLISSWAWARVSAEIERTNHHSLPPQFEFRLFQSEVAESASYLTLAQAGCGSGKSIAAYLWAQSWRENLEQTGRTNFRLFFCLPTTGTTTEHFKDYALESGIEKELIALTHSRYSVDLKAIAETAAQEEASEKEVQAGESAQAALKAERDKIEALALWSTPLVVSTADTVLGLMANARRAVCSLPSILSSAVVFDEIHAFDDQMFGHLLIFLKYFPKLPVLLMTASLPEERKRAIQAVRPDLNVIAGPPDFETLERYVIEEESGKDKLWERVRGCINHQGKVLWIRNRVDWANETYADCRMKFGDISVDVYHARLRYKDRSHRHRRVIDDFKANDKSAILVATQVAEMSLDLSADLLITDIAPIPSLIQRLGRLNRRSTPDNKLDPKPVIFCALPNADKNPSAPYEIEEIETARKWIATLKEKQRPLSQRDLAEAFATFSNPSEYDIAKAEDRAVFFSGLWRTRVGMTRGEGYTITVLLEKDLNDWKKANGNRDPERDWLREHEVAIPVKKEAMQWERIAGLRIAPDNQVAYDFDEKTKKGTGAKWRKS